jgi:hypothetical protein
MGVRRAQGQQNKTKWNRNMKTRTPQAGQLTQGANAGSKTTGGSFSGEKGICATHSDGAPGPTVAGAVPLLLTPLAL